MFSATSPLVWHLGALAILGATALSTLDGLALEFALRTITALLGMVAAVLLWRACDTVPPTESRGFRILSIGLGFWSMGIAVHLLDLLQGSFSVRYPPADAFFMLSAFCSVVGMAKLPTAHPFAKAKRILFLDQAIAATASGAIFWHLVLAPNLGKWEQHTPGQIAISLLYMVVEFVILQMAIDLVVRGPSRQELKPVYWMASAGFLSLLTGNVVMEFDFWRDRGWDRHPLHATNLFFAMAMLWATLRLIRPKGTPPTPPSRWLALRESLVPLAWVTIPSMAFAWILLVGGIGFAWDLLLVSLFLVVLVVIRQRMAERHLAADLRSTLLASLLPTILGLHLVVLLTACMVLGATFQRIAGEEFFHQVIDRAASIDRKAPSATDSGGSVDRVSWRVLSTDAHPWNISPAQWGLPSGIARVADPGSLYPRLVAWIDLPSRPGSRLVQSAPQLIYADRARQAGAILFLFTLAGAAVTTWRIVLKARDLARPLDALTNAASAVQVGDLTVRVGLEGIDEMSRLGQAMDSMVDRLSQMLREQRELAEKAKEASQAKSRFLANMSHEIRTPLNGILGIAELLASENLPPAERGLVDDLKASASSLRDLVGDILDLSKIEAERILIEFVPFHPSDVVGQVAGALRACGDGQGLELVARWESPAEATVVGDPLRTRQILSNLVSNAIKFTSEGSVAIRGRIEGGDVQRLVFEIDDTGTGIPPQSQERIWQEFVQADESTTRRFGGTGLGLPISRSLARLMGGELTLLESVPGEGSRFLLEIPLPEHSRMAPDAPANDAAEEAAPCAGLRVLVAEDNAVNQRVIAGFLHRLGCQVQLATDGVEAVASALDARPDLVLMDVHMPRMDGLEAARELRGRGFLGRIWALTASTMETEFDRCMEAGMDGFLAKPIGLSDLRAMIRKEFDERRKPG